jgi:ABC-type nitrate/sulfonate/bicarbonate transport system substrate-binding protein
VTKIRLGFKAFDPHELLCHFVAVRAGLYERERLAVELTDLTFTPDAELPPEICQVSCGAALQGALQGNPQRVVFVATERPMFWLHGAVPDLAALRGRTVATYPAVAPPARFARMILQGAGLDPDADVTLAPARDDTARLGLLRSGSAAAAVLSSAVPPPVVERLGFRTLSFFGDAIRIPTTGLAVHARRLAEDRAQVAALVRVLKGGLDRLHRESALAARVLQETFDIDAAIAPATAALLERHFSRNGRTDAALAQGVIDRMRAALGVERPLAFEEVYDFTLVPDD